MDIRNLEGSIVALVTPFCADGSIDFAALERLVDFHLQNNTDAILVLGTTGESATMTDEEDNAVVAAVVKQVAGRIPVIAGSGSNSTATMLDKSLSYQRLGADGLLTITPYYNKSNEEGIYQQTPSTSRASSTTFPAAAVAALASTTSSAWLPTPTSWALKRPAATSRLLRASRIFCPTSFACTLAKTPSLCRL